MVIISKTSHKKVYNSNIARPKLDESSYDDMKRLYHRLCY